MPRIRTLKPDHRLHRKTGALDHLTYRLWVGMILEADDEGRLVADPAQLRALIFGLQPRVTGPMIETALATLATVGLIQRYRVERTDYVCFPSWLDHQRINRPMPSRLPPCPEEPQRQPEASADDSVSVHGAFTEDSQRKGSGREGKGRESLMSGSRPTAEVEILGWLNSKAGRTYRPCKTNLDFIRARLKDGIAPWQLKAIVSRKVRDWQGTEQAKYLRPETLFNKTKCEGYLGELPPHEEASDGAGMP